MPVIPILGRLKQNYREFEANLNYNCKLQDSLDYRVRPKLKTITNKQTPIHNKNRHTRLES